MLPVAFGSSVAKQLPQVMSPHVFFFAPSRFKRRPWQVSLFGRHLVWTRGHSTQLLSRTHRQSTSRPATPALQLCSRREVPPLRHLPAISLATLTTGSCCMMLLLLVTWMLFVVLRRRPLHILLPDQQLLTPARLTRGRKVLTHGLHQILVLLRPSRPRTLLPPP